MQRNFAKCLSSCCRRGCWHNSKLRQENGTFLVTPFWICQHPLHIPKRLCGRTAPVLEFRLVFFPRIWDGFRSWGSNFWMISLRWTFSFPISLAWRIVVWENLTVWFVPNFAFSRRVDFFRGLAWDTQPNWTVSVTKANDPFAPHFFDIVQRCPPASISRNWQLSDLWFKHAGRCQTSHDGSVHVPFNEFYTVFCLSILKDFLLLSSCHMCKAFFRQSVLAL